MCFTIASPGRCPEFAAAGLVHPVEPLKQAWQVLRRVPGPSSATSKLDELFVFHLDLPDRDRDLGPGRAILMALPMRFVIACSARQVASMYSDFDTWRMIGIFFCFASAPDGP